MDEPLIVAYGRQFINKYPPEEFLQSLIRAFRLERADYIVLDDNTHGQRFLSASVAWGIDRGYLYCSQTDSDDQSVVSAFRLTDLGKRVIIGDHLSSLSAGA